MMLAFKYNTTKSKYIFIMQESVEECFTQYVNCDKVSGQALRVKCKFNRARKRTLVSGGRTQQDLEYSNSI